MPFARTLRPTQVVRSAAVAISTLALTASVGVATMPTASAATAASTMQVTAATLNVRTGPGTAYATAGSLKSGTTITGTATNGWFKISSGAYAGKYVSAGYLKAVTTTAPAPVPKPAATQSTAPTSTRVTTANLNVRTGPGTTYATAGSLSSATTVTGTESNGWFKISSGAYAGKYVSAAYLKTTAAPASAPTTASTSQTVMYVTAADESARIRSSASFSASIVGYAKPHTKVSGSVTADGLWLKTSTGYIRTSTLTTNSNPASFNARIPLNTLCTIPTKFNSQQSFNPGYTPSTVRYFSCDALTQLSALEEAYKAQFGHYAGIDLAYRDYAEQQYWYKLLGPAVAAVPGTSNHGYGLAVDFQEQDGHVEFNWGEYGLTWLIANAPKYGFTNRFIAYKTAHESYHWAFTG